jgi:hypothetical protein
MIGQMSAVIFFGSLWIGMLAVWFVIDTSATKTPFARLTISDLGGLVWAIAWRAVVSYFLAVWTFSKREDYASWARFGVAQLAILIAAFIIIVQMIR